MAVLNMDFSQFKYAENESTFKEISVLSRFTFQQLCDKANNEFHNGESVAALKIVEEMKQRIWNNAL